TASPDRWIAGKRLIRKAFVQHWPAHPIAHPSRRADPPRRSFVNARRQWSAGASRRTRPHGSPGDTKYRPETAQCASSPEGQEIQLSIDAKSGMKPIALESQVQP